MRTKRTNRRRLFSEALESRILLAADPAVVPVQAHAFGTTYSELGQDWWNYQASEFETHPADGGPCSANQSGKVWFLPGSSGPPLDVTCTVPTGKALFVPSLAYLATPDDPGNFPEQEADLRAEANFSIDVIASLSATLDGVDIDAFDYRAESPEGGFTFNVPDGSIFAAFATPGSYSPAVTDGYWLLLKPLSPGTHNLDLAGVVEIGGEVVFEFEASYEIEVVGGGRAADILDRGNDPAVVSVLDAADESAFLAEESSSVLAFEPFASESDDSAFGQSTLVEISGIGATEPGSDAHEESGLDDELLSILAADWRAELAI